MSKSTYNELWCHLLSNIVFIPFMALLTVLIAHQAISLRSYAVNIKAKPNTAAEFINDGLL